MSNPSQVPSAAHGFDTIVVGGGSAGCVMASRLSERSAHSVLLLEAGVDAPPGREPDDILDIYPASYYNKSYMWPALKVHWRDATNSPAIGYDQARIIGGGSSVMGMVALRGAPDDYDEWERLGAAGWGWDSVLPYFRKLEHNVRGADAYHGDDGPLWASDIESRHPLIDAFIDAAAELGIAPNRDFNGATQEGAGYYQATVGKGRRWSAATAYLKPARERRNLVVKPNAHATRIVIENGRAVGVEFRTSRGMEIARAKGEVIVSGGVYGSPQLLLLSGIGPGDHLNEMGIDVTHNLAPVGANLHDHFNSYVAWRSTKTGTFNELHRSPFRKLAAGARYLVGRDGPMTAIATHAGILTRTDPRFDRPDLQINTYLWSIETRDRSGMHPHKWPGFSMSPVHLRPEGRGLVSLASPDPLAPPKIQFRFMESAHDVDAMIRGVRLARKLAEQPALKPYIAEEVVPGPAVRSDEQLVEDIRNRGVSNLHPVGTCRMGTGRDAVVDPRLRVHGIRGLRVADASIMPLVVGGNTNAPSVMIGEKCAAMVLEDA